MSRRFKSPRTIVGSSWDASRRWSAASLIAECSRSTALIRVCHSCCCGMLLHLCKDFPERILGERLSWGLARGHGAVGARGEIMQVPAIVVVVQSCDVVVSGHQVEIDDAFHAWRRPADRLKQHSRGVFLHEQSEDLVLANI